MNSYKFTANEYYVDKTHEVARQVSLIGMYITVSKVTIVSVGQSYFLIITVNPY